MRKFVPPGTKIRVYDEEGEIMINVKSWGPAATSGLLLQPSRATRVAFFHFRASLPTLLCYLWISCIYFTYEEAIMLLLININKAG